MAGDGLQVLGFDTACPRPVSAPVFLQAQGTQGAVSPEPGSFPPSDPGPPRDRALRSLRKPRGSLLSRGWVLPGGRKARPGSLLRVRGLAQEQSIQLQPVTSHPRWPHCRGTSESPSRQAGTRQQGGTAADCPPGLGSPPAPSLPGRSFTRRGLDSPPGKRERHLRDGEVGVL